MKILVAEDEALWRRILHLHLSAWGYEVIIAADGEQAWSLLSQPEPPQLAILDWHMPKLDGPEVCRLVRQQAREPHAYLMLLTGNDDRAALVQGFNAGADDYVTKPFDASELQVRLQNAQRRVALQSDLVAAREALRFEATHDLLTGVQNRRAVMTVLGQELARIDRDGAQVSVIMGDLDHFKSVNDHHGHPTGDAVLKATAERLRSAVRLYDTLGRYGGEEFLIVLPGCGLAEAGDIAERLRSSIDEAPVRHNGVTLDMTASFGVATSSVDLGIDELIGRADDALYRAKRAGRNRVELDPSGRTEPPCSPAAFVTTARSCTTMRPPPSYRRRPRTSRPS